VFSSDYSNTGLDFIDHPNFGNSVNFVGGRFTDFFLGSETEPAAFCIVLSASSGTLSAAKSSGANWDSRRYIWATDNVVNMPAVSLANTPKRERKVNITDTNLGEYEKSRTLIDEQNVSSLSQGF
jgi:hypothetical protein